MYEHIYHNFHLSIYFSYNNSIKFKNWIHLFFLHQDVILKQKIKIINFMICLYKTLIRYLIYRCGLAFSYYWLFYLLEFCKNEKCLFYNFNTITKSLCIYTIIQLLRGVLILINALMRADIMNCSRIFLSPNDVPILYHIIYIKL